MNGAYEVNSRFDLEGSQSSKFNLAKQFEDQMDAFAAQSQQDDDPFEKQTTSSIFSNAQYIKEKSPIKEFKLDENDDQDELQNDQIQAQALDFLDNMLDSGSDEEKEKSSDKQQEAIQPVKQQSVPSIFNSMSLFAITGDG